MSRKMKDRAPKLSSNVLEMKFMKRTKLKLEAKEKQKKDLELFSECNPSTSESILNNNVLDQVEICRDWQQLEGLVFGRQSFKGFNPEVEKLMIYYEKKRNGELSDSESDDGETEVNNKQMAKTLNRKRKGDANEEKGYSSKNKRKMKKRVDSHQIPEQEEKESDDDGPNVFQEL